MVERGGFDHTPEMGFEAHMNTLQEMAMAEVMAMENTPGMEVFFNVEGLPEFTASIISHIAEHPGETFVVGVGGKSGVGKRGVAGGILNTILNSTVIARAVAAAGSPLEASYMSTGDACRAEMRDPAGAFSPADPWGKYTPEQFHRLSERQAKGVQWAFTDKPFGQPSPTRVVIAEVPAFTSPDPLTPSTQVPVDRNDPDSPLMHNVDIGGSLFALYGSHPNFFGIGVVADDRVQEVAAQVRDRVEDCVKMGGSKDEKEKAMAAMMEEHGQKLDILMPPEEMVRDNGNRHTIELTRRIIHDNIAAVGPQQLNTGPFTREELDTDPWIRKAAEGAYMRWCFDRWGVRNSLVEKNPILPDEIKRTHFIGLTRKHPFPFAVVQTPEPLIA